MGKKASICRSLAATSLFLAMGGAALSATTAAADSDSAQQALALYKAAGKSTTSLAGWQELGRLQATVKDNHERSFIRQIRAMLSSELGLYDEAIAEFPFSTNKAVAAGPLPDAGYRIVDAADAIARLARERRVVIVNEAHHVPQTRVLLLELLPRLRKLGFTDYAAETLDSNAGTAIAQRGYAVRKDGVYAREPVFGQLLRTVAKLGYRIDSYEATATKSIQERETTQAINLAKLLSDHPDARLIIHVGYTHVRVGKTPERTPMAAELKRLAGIDPLTIDQTMFTADIPAARENPAYRQLLSRLASSQIAAAVFVTANGTPWSYEPGQYDVSVILPAPPRVMVALAGCGRRPCSGNHSTATPTCATALSLARFRRVSRTKASMLCRQTRCYCAKPMARRRWRCRRATIIWSPPTRRIAHSASALSI